MSDLINLKNICNFPSNVGNHLIKNQEILKMLKYSESNCLSKPDLGIPDIVNLSGKGQDPIKDKRIFRQPYHTEITEDIRTEIRYFIPIIKPESIYMANVNIVFQLIIHNSIFDMDNNIDRSLYLTHKIIEHFNDADIGGIGKLQLISPARFQAWSTEFSGYTFGFSTRGV